MAEDLNLKRVTYARVWLDGAGAGVCRNREWPRYMLTVTGTPS